MMNDVSPGLTPSLPPGPRGRLWQTISYFRGADQFLQSQVREFGDIFTVSFFGVPQPVVMVGHPEGARALFTADPDSFAGPRTDALLPMMGEHSLLALNGDAHRRERKLLMSPFNGARMRAYGRTIAAIAERMVSGWSVGDTIDVRQATRALSIEVILRMVFGVEDDTAVERFRSAVAEYLSPRHIVGLWFGPLQRPWFPPWRRFVAVRAHLDQLIYEHIAAVRRRAVAGEDILSLLIGARYEDGSPMEDVAIRDELVTLLIAGHETGAQSLSWALYWLHRYPETLAKLLAELTALGPAPEPEAIAAAPYLEAVCNESLRLHPVVNDAGRRLLRPMTILGREIPAGATVTASVLMIHRRKELYPDAHSFRPERFLERRFSAFEFLPFGGGHRRCIGAAFALYEMKILLATLLGQQRLTLVDTRDVKPALRGIAMGPNRPVKLRVQPR
jgi:cytochrome P450